MENIRTHTHTSVYQGMSIQVKHEHFLYDVISDIWYLRYVSLPRSFDAYIYTCVQRFFSFIYIQQSCFSVLHHRRSVYLLTCTWTLDVWYVFSSLRIFFLSFLASCRWPCSLSLSLYYLPFAKVCLIVFLEKKPKWQSSRRCSKIFARRNNS
jgi:hypothetical protein